MQDKLDSDSSASDSGTADVDGSEPAGSARSDSDTAAPAIEEPPARSRSRVRGIAGRALWTGHWLLRLWLAGYLLVYGWSKVFLMQMGLADFADALVQYGEMSPMGLLWRFMAFSPTVQVVAGLAEVAAAAFLLFRRTAWIGAIIAAADMTVVFLLNLNYDVPVKQLSGIMALAGVILLIPNVPRLCRFLTGRASGPAVSGQISTNRIFLRLTQWASPLLAIALLGGSGLVFGNMADWGRLEESSEIAGVYRVSNDSRSDFGDSQLIQVAFGQLTKDGRAAVGLRYEDGSLQKGQYMIEGEDTLKLRLYAKQKGSQGLVRDYVDEVTLRYAIDGSGDVTATGSGLDATLTPDPERRYLFDREFRWGPREPINR